MSNVVALNRAHEPVKQPRMFRRYRDQQEVPYLPLVHHRRRREREERLKEENPVGKADILFELIVALMLATPAKQRSTINSSLWRLASGKGDEPYQVRRREAALSARALVMQAEYFAREKL